MSTFSGVGRIGKSGRVAVSDIGKITVEGMTRGDSGKCTNYQEIGDSFSTPENFILRIVLKNGKIIKVKQGSNKAAAEYIAAFLQKEISK